MAWKWTTRARPAVGPFLLLLVLSACSGDDAELAEASSEPPARRPDVFCPRLVPGHLPSGWVALDSRLVNLGERTFGRIDTYGKVPGDGRDGAARVEIHVGVDGLDALEDLDFEPSVVESEGRRFRFYRTPVDHGLFALKGSDGEDTCTQRTLVSRAISKQQLLAIALGLREQGGEQAHLDAEQDVTSDARQNG